MKNYHWCVFLLVVSISSLVDAKCGKCGIQMPAVLVDLQKSPRPNPDLLDVRTSLRSAWMDGIDSWFLNKISDGNKTLISIARDGLLLSDELIKIDPTPEAVFQSPKHVLTAMPEEVIVYAVNAHCSVESHVHKIKPFTPEKHQMRVVYVADGIPFVAKMHHVDIICDHPKFNKRALTVLVVTGWLSGGNSTNEALQALQTAFMTKDVNFMFFDMAQFIDTLYTWSVFNTKDIGKVLGEALVSLKKCIYPHNLHLIGHSLGAHISGYAARTYNCLTEQLVGRITGLDPANPCDRDVDDINGLRRGDAEFVDIIHTNSGVFGGRSPRGDVDFYPNGRHPLQPGCLTNNCSHSRSWEFYAESVTRGNELIFLSRRCDSYSSFKDGRCKHTGRLVRMGFSVQTTTKGDYFLETTRFKPFGLKKHYELFCSPS